MIRNRSRHGVAGGLSVLLALIALTLAACGDDGADQDAGGGGPELTQGEKVVVQSAQGFDAAGIYRRDARGVVTVISTFDRAERDGSQGSGFVIDRNGEIATNAHVITTGQGSAIRKARRVYIEFSDRNRVPAEIVGFDPNADVGLVKIDPGSLDLHPIALASDDPVVVGSPVAAIGSPFGQEQSLSVGVVSATDRSVESLTDFHIEGAIQTDAAINRGNSGGPLLNSDGQVIGINQQIQTSSGGGEGVGFAVPIRVVRHSLDELRRHHEVRYAFIGVSTQSLYPQLADHLGIDAKAGALVGEVLKGGPADKAGIRGGGREIRFQGQEITTGGDTIVAVDGKRLVDEGDLSRLIGLRNPGTTVEVEVIRDGKRRKIDVKLTGRPSSVPD